MLSLRETQAFSPQDVQGVQCRLPKFCIDAACIIDPRDGLEGKFSTSYCVALALLEGRADYDLFSPPHPNRSEIRELMQRVTLEHAPEFNENQAEVVISLKDGRELRHLTDGPKGSPDKPVSNTELERKFKSLNADEYSEAQTVQILDQLRRFDQLGDVSQLAELCVADT